jgi:hypothetical protein
VQGAILDRSSIINVVDANSDALSTTGRGGEHIFNTTNLEDPSPVRSDGGLFGILIHDSLTSQERRKVDRVSREERFLRDYEVGLCFIHKGSITQKRGDVKGQFILFFTPEGREFQFHGGSIPHQIEIASFFMH